MLMEKRPKVVVAGLVVNDGKVLLARELVEDGKEYWVVPGGKVEFGETLEEALTREMWEETSLHVKPEKFIGFNEAIFPQNNYHAIIFFYLCSSREMPERNVDDKVKELRFFSIDELPGLNLVDSARWALQKAGFLP